MLNERFQMDTKPKSQKMSEASSAKGPAEKIEEQQTSPATRVPESKNQP